MKFLALVCLCVITGCCHTQPKKRDVHRELCIQSSAQPGKIEDATISVSLKLTF